MSSCHTYFSRPAVLLALATALTLLCSCGSSRTQMRAHSVHSTHSTTSAANTRTPASSDFTISPAVDEPVKRLLTEARSWLGTQYKYGGEDTDGVDCSGFVSQVFNRSLNIKLPRNSAKQEEFCRKIDRDKLAAGDLVFFTTRGGKGVGHVGIYIGDGQMIHSSTGKGVIITPLDQKYYVDNYYSSGRVEQLSAMKGTAKAAATVKPAVNPATNQAVNQAVNQAAKPAAASSMEADRQKALNSLINQIEDSIFSFK